MLRDQRPGILTSPKTGKDSAFAVSPYSYIFFEHRQSWRIFASNYYVKIGLDIMLYICYNVCIVKDGGCQENNDNDKNTKTK